MNWYKSAQLYEDILGDSPEEYGSPKDREAYLYFSIGQNEETTDESYCWVWKRGRLYVEQGPTTHNLVFGRDSLNYYRGWYDPEQKLLSVAVPPGKPRFNYEEQDLPSGLTRDLNYTFGNDYKIKIFT